MCTLDDFKYDRCISELKAEITDLKDSLASSEFNLSESEMELEAVKAENKRLRDALQEIQRVCISPNLVENLAIQALKEGSDAG